MRQEITRSGSDNNVGTTETEVTETTETIEGGTTLTTVKRKVVTVIQGKEEVIEDSQLIVDGNDTAFSSVIDGGFVVVDKEETHEVEENDVHHEDKSKLNAIYRIAAFFPSVLSIGPESFVKSFVQNVNFC